MGLQPLQDWALIEPSESKERTAGGLFIPDTAKEKPVEGKVLAVGKGRWETPEKSGRANPKRRKKRCSSPRSSSQAIRLSISNTQAPRLSWMGRNSCLFVNRTFLGG